MSELGQAQVKLKVMVKVGIEVDVEIVVEVGVQLIAWVVVGGGRTKTKLMLNSSRS